MRHSLCSNLAVGVALEGVDVQVLVVVLFLLRCRFGRGGATEQLKSLKRNDAKQHHDNRYKDNFCYWIEIRKARRLFLGVVVAIIIVVIGVAIGV